MLTLNKLFKFLAVVVIAIGSSSMQGQSKAGYFRLMQGPVLGAVDEASALIWVRGSYSFPVVVEYSENRDMTDAQLTAPWDLSKENDYCTVMTIENLNPATRYYYRILIEGKPDRYCHFLSRRHLLTPSRGSSELPLDHVLGSRWTRDR